MKRTSVYIWHIQFLTAIFMNQMNTGFCRPHIRDCQHFRCQFQDIKRLMCQRYVLVIQFTDLQYII